MLHFNACYSTARFFWVTSHCSGYWRCVASLRAKSLQLIKILAYIVKQSSTRSGYALPCVEVIKLRMFEFDTWEIARLIDTLGINWCKRPIPSVRNCLESLIRVDLLLIFYFYFLLTETLEVPCSTMALATWKYSV